MAATSDEETDVIYEHWPSVGLRLALTTPGTTVTLPVTAPPWRRAHLAALVVVTLALAGVVAPLSHRLAAPATLAGPVEEATSGQWPAGLAEAAEMAVMSDAYAFATDASTVVADNPAQGFTARFEAAGPILAPSEGSDWELALTLEATGRGVNLAPVPEASQVVPSQDQAILEYRRGSLTEWYRNGPKGIEQGFTLAEAPPGSGPLVLEQSLGGTLAASQTPGSQDIMLLSPDGVSTLSYAGLYAYDATGAALASSMTTDGSTITLLVDDAGAAYPLVIDPVISDQQAAKLTAADAAVGDLFGVSVAVSGDTAVVGAIGGVESSGSGSAYVFVRTGTTWTQQAKLTAADAAKGPRINYTLVSHLVIDRWIV